MYGRNYAGKTLHFEPSGGLIHATLVMQDRETDSYWPILNGEAIAGDLDGTLLDELTIGEKAQWADWKGRYPHTLVLSVGGQEHADSNPYDNYLSSDRVFRDGQLADTRLSAKAHIFAFELEGTPYAVASEHFTGSGVLLQLGDHQILLQRPAGAAIYRSSAAFVAPKPAEGDAFEAHSGTWVHRASGSRLDPASASFVGEGASTVQRLPGVDTFWFNWSMNRPATEVVTP